MKSQPSFKLLLDWVEGHLSEQDSKAMVNQLASAKQATLNDLAWIEGFRQATEDIQLHLPPPRVRNVLTDRFEAFAEGRRPPTFLQQLKALLTFDSHQQFAIAGVRSATSLGQRRQLIFSTDMAEIALNVQPQKQEPVVNLTGQLFILTQEDEEEEDFLLATVQLLQRACTDAGSKSQVAMTTIDDYGEFIFSDIPSGEYEMVISSDDFELLISPLLLST